MIRPLGRHVEHDVASLSFPAERASALADVDHRRHGRIFDQGDLGSCTGNAMAGLLNCDGTRPSTLLRYLGELDAVSLYKLATSLDSIPGSYPPDDTGSSGLAVAKAAKQRGWVASYRHAFGLDHALAALALRAVIIGIPWYDSFDEPGPDGLIEISPNAGVRGGHEVLLRRLRVSTKRVGGDNSWSTSWGASGSFWMTWATLDRLLHEAGDATTVEVA